MGIVDSWQATPDLDRLLNPPENRSQWEARIGALLQKDKEYRKVRQVDCSAACAHGAVVTGNPSCCDRRPTLNGAASKNRS